MLEDCDSSIVQIERFPRLHHIGDDIFEGQANSAFQREAEGQPFSYQFNLPQNNSDYIKFTIKFFVKGVDATNSVFAFNNPPDIALPSNENESNFLELSFEGNIADYLVFGTTNTLTISASSNGFNTDEFEFVNLVLYFY